MTNWVVVVVDFGIIAFVYVLYRNAEGFARLQQRQGKAMRYPEAIRNRFTPGLARFGAIGFAIMGIVWILGARS